MILVHPLLVLPQAAAAEVLQQWRPQVSDVPRCSSECVLDMLSSDWGARLGPLSIDMAYLIQGGRDHNSMATHYADVLRHTVLFLVQTGMWATLQYLLATVAPNQTAVAGVATPCSDIAAAVAPDVTASTPTTTASCCPSQTDAVVTEGALPPGSLQHSVQYAALQAMQQTSGSSIPTAEVADSCNTGSLLRAVAVGFSTPGWEQQYVHYKQAQSQCLDWVAVVYHALLGGSAAIGYSSTAWPARLGKAGFVLAHAGPPLLVLLCKPHLGVHKERLILAHNLVLAMFSAGIAALYIPVPPNVVKLFRPPGSWLDATVMWAAMAPTRGLLSQVCVAVWTEAIKMTQINTVLCVSWCLQHAASATGAYRCNWHI